MSLASSSTPSSKIRLGIGSVLQKDKREEPSKKDKAEMDKEIEEVEKAKAEKDAKAKAEKDDKASPAQDDKAKPEKESSSGFFDNWDWKKGGVYFACGCLGALIVGTCLYCCCCAGKSKKGGGKEGDASSKAALIDDEDAENIALSDSLLRELVCRSLQKIGPSLARGAALQGTVEKSIRDITGKAQQLLMSELNCAAGSICQTMDAEEAMLILDWDAAVRANFPAVTVLLAGVLAPTLLQVNKIGHLTMVGFLLLPVFLLCAWASWQDWGIPCVAIPTIFIWLYVQGIMALVLCVARLLMVWQIRSGQNQLQQKAAEFQERRQGRKEVIGSLGELQELFVSHSVLVQHALLIEESVNSSIWNKIVGFGTFLWIVVTVWGTVLVLGWTFVPGRVAFHADAAQAAGDHYCGAWATVFVARLVVVIGVMFFLTNAASALSWASNLALATPWIQTQARHWARTFDARFQGLPVMQVLFKTFVLPRSVDTASAELAAELHEQTVMEEEQNACQERLKTIQSQLDAQKKKLSGLKNKVNNDGDKDKLEDRLAQLEKRSRDAIDGGEWKKHGEAAVDAAKANALTIEEASTQELERVFNRIREAADQIQNSEQAQEMLQQAQQVAQSTAEAGKAKLQELSESEQGQQVRAAVATAGASASAAAEVAKEKATAAAEVAKEKAAAAAEEVKKAKEEKQKGKK